MTPIGKLLNELGINSIAANSPQAKGRADHIKIAVYIFHF